MAVRTISGRLCPRAVSSSRRNSSWVAISRFPDAESFVRDAAADPDGIRIMSITDLPGGNPALPPESFVSFILENGLTPLAHLSGKDGNRAFIESRLHGLARAGAESILALTGDAPKDGFRGRPRPVYDLDSVFILMLIKAMREGLAYQLGLAHGQDHAVRFPARRRGQPVQDLRSRTR